MVASWSVAPLRGSLVSQPRRRRGRLLPVDHTASSRLAPVAAPALLVVVLSLAAVLIAPEQPHDQAAICQRHNGAEACRVW
jgi:hypothetical protein